MTVCALTTPPATLSLRMYALTRSSYCSSLSGRPRGEYGKTLSVFLLGQPWKKCFGAAYRAFGYFSPQVLTKMAGSFCRTILNRRTGHLWGWWLFPLQYYTEQWFVLLESHVFNLCRIRHGWRIGCRFSNVRCLTQFNIGIFLLNIYNYSMWTMWASFTDNYLREVTLSSVKLKASRKVTTRQTVKLKTPGIEDVYSINYTFRLFKSKCFCVWGLCRIGRLGEGGGVGG